MVDARIGRLFGGKYRVASMIGEGGMGSVYDAVDVASGTEVALKVLRAGRDGEKRVERLRREALAIAALHHPHIVRLLDQGTDADGTVYLVMERLAGETLKARMDREGRFAPRAAVALAMELLDGLGAAHARGIVHRDIKPTNVMLVPDAAGRERVVILDFGVAKLFAAGELETLTATGQMVGTPAYMSPEQARGQTIDARTDVHAVGVLLYRALTGRVPYVGKDTADVIFQVLAGEKLPIERVLPRIDPSLASVVARAMERRPSDRFSSADEMRAELAEWSAREMSGRLDTAEDAPTLPDTHPRPDPIVTEAPGAILTAATRGASPRALAPSEPRPAEPRRIGLLALVVVALGSASIAGVVAWIVASSPSRSASVANGEGVGPASPVPVPVPLPMSPTDAGSVAGRAADAGSRAGADAGGPAASGSADPEPHATTGRTHVTREAYTSIEDLMNATSVCGTRAPSVDERPFVGMWTGSSDCAVRRIQAAVNQCVAPNPERVTTWVEVHSDGGLCVESARLGGPGVTPLAQRCFAQKMRDVLHCGASLVIVPDQTQFRLIFDMLPCRTAN